MTKTIHHISKESRRSDISQYLKCSTFDIAISKQESRSNRAARTSDRCAGRAWLESELVGQCTSLLVLSFVQSLVACWTIHARNKVYVVVGMILAARNFGFAPPFPPSLLSSAPHSRKLLGSGSVCSGSGSVSISHCGSSHPPTHARRGNGWGVRGRCILTAPTMQHQGPL